MPSKNVLELEARKKICKKSPLEQNSNLENLEKYGITHSFKKRDESRPSADYGREILSHSIRYSTDNFDRLKTELDEVLSFSRRESQSSAILALRNESTKVDKGLQSIKLPSDIYFKTEFMGNSPKQSMQTKSIILRDDKDDSDALDFNKR